LDRGLDYCRGYPGVQQSVESGGMFPCWLTIGQADDVMQASLFASWFTCKFFPTILISR
jgi:hypothetical protein